MRLIDADTIISRIKPLIEAERQIYNKASWNFVEKCLTVVESAPIVSAELDWIPCSERLPEPDERVLVYTVANEYHVWDAMPHRGEDYQWEDEEGFCHNKYEVDLWMPLP